MDTPTDIFNKDKLNRLMNVSKEQFDEAVLKYEPKATDIIDNLVLAEIIGKKKTGPKEIEFCKKRLS